MAAMTDLEMTRLCAEAMGFEVHHEENLRQGLSGSAELWYLRSGDRWNPLHDDAQLMALVKAFQMMIWPPRFNKGRKDWLARIQDENENMLMQVYDPDLNRAAVTCVAKIEFQKEKSHDR